MVKFANEKDCFNQLTKAMKSGDEKQIKEAWKALHDSIAEQVKADFSDLQESHDAAVLAERGYRQLTSKERKWYNKMIDALRSNNPKQAFTDIIGSEDEADLMPTTIIEDVYKHLQDEHPLLAAINFQYCGYVTKWIQNDHSVQNAVWGNITDEISKEITSAFEVIDINQSKLTAFAVIEHGMLDLGPVFLDGYIRAVLSEAIMAGLEDAIVNGTGVNMPIGLTRNISKGASFNTDTGYATKEAVEVKSFSPVEYGDLLARMSKTEKDHKRKFSQVGLICNQTDYLTKIMPATTVLNSNGTYVNNLFPFATKVYISNAVDTDRAILFIEDEYFLGMGGSKNGVIEYSDDYKFIEDQRVFKVKQYGMGRAFDNTSALLLNISGIEPAYITVQNIPTV